MIISLAQGYEKALAIVAAIVKSRAVAINLLTDATTYPMVPVAHYTIAVTYFPRGGSQYGSGVYSICTSWELDLLRADPISFI